MSHGIFLISIFGFLLAEEKAGQLDLFTHQHGLASFLWRCFHLFWQTLALVSFYTLTIDLWVSVGHRSEWASLILAPVAYGLSRMIKESDRFFLAIYLISFFALRDDNGFLWIGRFWIGCYLVFGIILFQVLILGMEEKLVLCRIPEPWRGSPLLLITASIVALILWGLGGGA